MKKKWLGFLTAAFALTTAFGFAACKDDDKVDSGKGEKTQIEQIYDQYVVYAEAEGQEPLSYEQWLETIKGATGEKGEKGETGVGISSVTVNEDGALVITFTNGTSQTVDMPAGGTVTENLRYQKISGKEEYRVMGMGTVSDLDIVIPATYRGLPVTEIGAYAFKDETYITSITIPDSVTTIGERAFYECESLASVTIPDSVTTIGEYTFYECESLTSVTIGDSVTSVGGGAFAYCENIKDLYYTGDIVGWCEIDFLWGEYVQTNPIDYVENFYIKGKLITGSLVIPENVKKIGERAFHGYKGLTSVTIPDSVTTIGDNAFSSCYSLTSVTINGVETMGYAAFSSCYSLTSVTIGDGVTSIGRYAFYNCDSLTSVAIPDSVTTIGDGAFSDCDGLTSITFEGTVAEWNAIEKSYSWNDGVPAEKVVCKDGEVSI